MGLGVVSFCLAEFAFTVYKASGESLLRTHLEILRIENVFFLYEFLATCHPRSFVLMTLTGWMKSARGQLQPRHELRRGRKALKARTRVTLRG